MSDDSLPSDQTADAPPHTPTLDPDNTRPSPDAVGVEGEVIADRYMLMRVIGEGGMGTVWLAQQFAPVKRAVAVKLIKGGMDSKVVLARFEAERQALALMDHPNIARVLDGGATADGRPFFVMELVKGVAITRFCDDRRLTPRQRLELFVQVCQAVQHAHQKGIIHRDLKPGNILVTEVDGKPVPKVIDFGVAKATGAALTDRTLMTGYGAVVGTPEYMSPEQASLDAVDVDTRSDVYALGVILYELLTGSTPVDRKSLHKAALLEILRIVREVDPPRPSTKIGSSDALPAVAAARGVEPKTLTGLLRSELDWIAMKALEKDRNRRYESATAFAADVQRYLRGEPVQAHPPSAAYRLRKFVRKYRVPVVAASLVLLALVGGVVGTTLGLLEAVRQADHARWQEGVAREEGENARIAGEKATAAAGREKEQRTRAERERDIARRNVVTTRLSQAAAVGDRDPVAGLALLDDPEGCPFDLRDFTWHLLRAKFDRVRASFRGHMKVPTSAACSPDGSEVATAGEDGGVFVWDVRTGKSRTVATADLVNGDTRWVAWRPASRQIAFTDRGQTRFWNVDTGKEEFALPVVGLGPPAFSAGGKRMAVTAGKAVRVWDVDGKKQLAALEGHTGMVEGVAFSPDGKHLLSGGGDMTARRWDVDAGTGKQVAKLDGPVRCVAWSPTGKLAAAAIGDFTNSGGRGVVLFDPETGAAKRTIRDGIVREVWGVAFTADGRSLATGNGGVVPIRGGPVDGEVQFWDVETGAERLALRRHVGSIQGFSLSADGTTLAAATGGSLRYDGMISPGGVTVWDVSARRESATLDTRGRVSLLALTPGGACGVGVGGVAWWDLAGRKELNRAAVKWRAEEESAPRTVAVSADGTTLAAVENHRRALSVSDLRTGGEVFSLTVSPRDPDITAVALSPTGRTLVYGLATGQAVVWDLVAKKEVRTFTAHPRMVGAIAFRPDGRTFATRGGTAGMRGEAAVWDTHTGKEVVRLQGDRWERGCVAFSPDGTRLASGDETGGVSVWDVTTGDRLANLSADLCPIRALAFSPDGQTLAGGGGSPTIARQEEFGEVHLWDVTTGQRRVTIPLPDPVSGLAFAADGRALAAATAPSDDKAVGTLRVWDAPEPALRGSLHGPTRTITGLSATGGRIAAMSLRDSAWVWEITTGQARTQAVGDNTPDTAVALSPDGTLLATTTTAATDPAGLSEVQLRDADTGRVRHRLTGFNPGGVKAVAFRPDGARVVAAEGGAGGRCRIREWDTATGELTATLPESKVCVAYLMYSPDGKRVYAGREDGKVESWDVTDGKPVWVAEAHKGAVGTVAVSADGKRVFTRGGDYFLKEWTADGKPVRQADVKRLVSAIAVSPDGELLFSANYDTLVRVYRTADLTEVGVFNGHLKPVSQVAVSPDGKTVVSGDQEGSVRLWQADRYTRTAAK